MGVERAAHGKLPTGEAVSIFTLRNGEVEASVTEYGATWVSMVVPSAKGGKADVLLGFDSLDGYLGDHPYFGATVGRFANRIGGAAFSIRGVRHALEANEAPNSLHSGSAGWGRKLWKGEAIAGKDAVEFRYSSPAGEGGFPGRVEARVVFELTPANELRLSFRAVADAATHVNMTNHAYFNLGAGPDVLSHRMKLSCSRYLEPGPGNIPTGKILDAAGTPFDFSESKSIGADIAATGSGYDHCFVVDRKGPGLVEAAYAEEPDSGRTMRVLTTQPGVQLYTGNYIRDTVGKGGRGYGKTGGFCLETQHYPDSVNHPEFPTVV